MSRSGSLGRCLGRDSRAFYARKRREGQRHHQDLIALARRRINLLWAMLHSRQPFQPGHAKAA